MTPLSPSAGRTFLDPRPTRRLALTAVVALPQRTPVAPPPHFADDFRGAVAAGNAVSPAMAWLAVRG